MQENCGIVEGLSVQNCSDPIHAEKLDAMNKSLRILILQNVPLLGWCAKNAHGLELLCIASARLPYKELSKLGQLQVLMICNPTDFEFENVEVSALLLFTQFGFLRFTKKFSL